MKKKLYLIISLVSFFIFFIPINKAEALNIEYFFYSDNASNIIWQAGFRIVNRLHDPITSRYTVMVRDPCFQGSNNCQTDLLDNIVSSYAEDEVEFQWGTGCIDPYVDIGRVGKDSFGRIVHYTGRLNVTLSHANINDLQGQSSPSHAFVDDIQWYEKNGGKTIWFGGFGDIDNCPHKPAFSCNTNGNGACIQRFCDPATDNNCYAGSSCGGTDCNGPISGQVFLPNGNPLNGAEVDRNGGTNQTTRNINGVNGSFRWTGLNIFSNHTIRLIRSSYDQCAYDIADNTQNAQVIDNNVNFRLSNVLYNINAHAYWDAEGDGIDAGDPDYNRDRITFGVEPSNPNRNCTTTDGTCAITGNPTDPGGKRYDITVSGLPAGDIVYSNNPISRTITCGNVGAPFAIAKGYRISGSIFKDLNYNGRYNPALGEELYTTANSGNTVGTNTVRIEGLGSRGGYRDQQTVTDGTYQFGGLFRGQYRVTIDDGDFNPLGYRFSAPVNNPKSFTVTVAPGAACTPDPTSLQDSCVTVAPWGGSIEDLNFGITPIYSISGGVFEDLNDNLRRDISANPNVNEPYMAGQQMRLTQGGVLFSDGAPFASANPQDTNPDYNFSFLLQDSYRVAFNWSPAIYQQYDAVGPVATPPSAANAPSFLVNLDRPALASCPTPDLSYLACNGLGIANLDFALKKITQGPWMQTFGGDVRFDKNFTNKLPDGERFSKIIPNISSYGIIFNKIGSTINLGANGDYNATNRHVVDSGLPGSIKMGYSQLSSLIEKSGNRATNVACQTPCALSSFTKTDKTSIYNLTSASGTVSIDGLFDVPAGRNYIFLVPGNLNINTDIQVPNGSGSTVTFAVGGKITVNGSVKDLQGIYATDGAFEFATLGFDATGKSLDTVINVEGSIIVGGTFMRTRKLTPRESAYGIGGSGGPTSTINISYRPDFVLNMPAIIRTALSKRIEVVPGN